MKLPRFVALAGALLATEAGYVLLLGMDPAAGVTKVVLLVWTLFLLLLAWWVAAARWQVATGPWTVLLVALMFRLTVVPLGVGTEGTGIPNALAEDLNGGRVTFRSALLLDDDVWRYLWDARVTRATGNPYLAPPGDPRLDGLAQEPQWEAIRSRVNHPHLATIYPPAAQGVFLAASLVAAGSVTAMKLVLIALDLLAIGGLMRLLTLTGRPRLVAVFYAWNPIVVLMFAGTAHVDVAMVAALVWCAVFVRQGRMLASGFVLGLAVLVKLAPLVLLPLLLRHAAKRGMAGVALAVVPASAPFLMAGGGGLATFGAFAGNWEFNAPLFSLLRAILSGLTNDPGGVARILLAGGVLAGALAVAARPPNVERFAGRAADTLGILLLGSPTLMPWYATWPLALAVAGRRSLWIALSAIVVLSFPMMVDWKTLPGLLALEGLLLLLWIGARGRLDGRDSSAGADVSES